MTDPQATLPTPSGGDTPFFAPEVGFPAPGELLADDLRVEGLLARGGMARVYLARDLRLDREVAVKLLDLPGAAPEVVERWQAQLEAEARATAAVAHPGVVAALRAGRWRERPFLVLERLRGETLDAWSRARPVDLDAALDLSSQAADALAACHAAGIAHRDVSPRNLWVQPDGRVRLLDLGLAAGPGRAAPPSAATPGFTPPERGTAAERPFADDPWALAAVLVRLLGGDPPGADPGPVLDALAAARPELPPSLLPLLRRALSPRPEDRPTPADLRAGLEVARAERAAARSAVPPYRYLDPFGEADAGMFFGREAEIDRLLARVDRHPVTLLVGPSGAGKSSLLHAGALPRLRARLGPGEVEATRPAAIGAGGARTDGVRVLVVDALEEAWTLGGAEATVAAVEAVVGSGGRALVAVRQEFLGRAAAALAGHDPDRLGVMVLVPPGPAELRAAVVGPARRLGFEVEPALLDALVGAVAGEASPLPLLQLAASRVWEARDPRRRSLTAAALRALGGVEGLLATHAEEVVAGLRGDEDALRAVLLALVTPARTRRPARRADLVGRDPAAARVVDRLVAGRLLTVRADADGPVVELAHEALITGWDRLARVVAESDRERALAEHVAQAAAAWVAQGRLDALLWAERALGPAEALLRARPELLDPAARAFVAAGLARARRRRRWVRTAAVGAALAALLVTTGALAGLRAYQTRAEEATAEARRAEEAGANADARALAADARRLLAVDGRRALSQALEAWERHPDREAADVLREAMAVPWLEASLAGHEAIVHGVAFSPDGTRVASAGGDGTVRVWTLAGAALATHRSTAASLFAVRWTPDGGRVLALDTDGGVWAWPGDGGAGRRRARLPALGLYLAVAPDGRRAAVGLLDGTLALLDVDGEAPPRLVPAHAAAIAWVDWSADGARVLTASADGSARVWTADGAPHAAVRAVDGLGATAVFDPDGHAFATGNGDGIVVLWDADGRRRRELVAHSGPISGLVPIPAAGMLLSYSRDRTARLWTVDGAPGAVLGGHGGRVTAAEASPDGQAVATVDDAGGVRLWALDGTLLAPLAGHLGWVTGVDWSADGRRLVTAGQDGSVRVWALDAVTLARLADRRAEAAAGRFAPRDGRAPARPDDAAFAAVRLPSGRVAFPAAAVDRPPTEVATVAGGGFVTLSGDRGARLWGPDGALRAELGGGRGPERRLAVAPGGTRIATGGAEARVWAPDGAPGGRLGAMAAPVSALAWHPSGGLLAVGGADGSVWTWEPAGGAARRLAGGFVGGVGGLAWSADGARLYAVGADGVLRAWTADGTPRARVDGHPQPARGLWALAGGGVVSASAGEARAWGPDLEPRGRMPAGSREALVVVQGDRVLVGTATGDAAVYDPDGAVMARLVGHEAAVTHGLFLADGRVLTGSWDGTVRLWAPDGRPLATASVYPQAVASMAASPDGRRIAAAGFDHVVRLWDAEGVSLGVLSRHDRPVMGLAFAADGGEVWSWSDDLAVQVAPVDAARVATAARARLAATPEVLPVRGRPGAYGTLR